MKTSIKIIAFAFIFGFAVTPAAIILSEIFGIIWGVLLIALFMICYRSFINQLL